MTEVSIQPASRLAGAARPSRSILADIRIDYGPPDALNRLFLNADTEARAKGIFLSFCSFEELLAINARNPDSWQPLLPMFRPGLGITDDSAFCIVARNASGEAVATTAIRFYRWLDTNLKAEAESLRMFYADPEKSSPPGNSCRITAASAADIKGRVAFSGAVWYRPDHRRLGLHDILGRVAKALAFTRWYTDTIFAFMAESIVARGFAQRSGYDKIEWDVLVNIAPWGQARAALLHSSTDYLMQNYLFDDLSAYAKIDGRIGHRAADQHRRA